jgi:hypothetical protein
LFYFDWNIAIAVSIFVGAITIAKMWRMGT